MDTDMDMELRITLLLPVTKRLLGEAAAACQPVDLGPPLMPVRAPVEHG